MLTRRRQPSLLHLRESVRAGQGLDTLRSDSIGALRRYTVPQATSALTRATWGAGMALDKVARQARYRGGR